MISIHLHPSPQLKKRFKTFGGKFYILKSVVGFGFTGETKKPGNLFEAKRFGGFYPVLFQDLKGKIGNGVQV